MIALRVVDIVCVVVLALAWFDLILGTVFWVGLLVWFCVVVLIYLLVCLCVVFGFDLVLPSC